MSEILWRLEQRVLGVKGCALQSNEGFLEIWKERKGCLPYAKHVKIKLSNLLLL